MNPFVTASTSFMCDLYSHLRGPDENTFFSPISAFFALAMLYVGARFDTAEDMRRVLRLHDTDGAALSQNARSILSVLTLDDDASGWTVEIANAVWTQVGYPFQENFLEVLGKHYRAQATSVDFVKRPEDAADVINAWAGEQTRDKITGIVTREMFTPLTRLILTNAIYFKAKWAAQFSTDSTHTAPFYMAKSETRPIDMMHLVDDFRYAESDGCQILEMAYGKSPFAMLAVLPKEMDGLPELDRSITPSMLDRWRADLTYRTVEVYFPRLKLEQTLVLSDSFKAMGMARAFSEEADFSGMTTAEKLLLSEAIQKSYVDITEQGTEAAAVTGIVALALGEEPEPPPPPPVFRADHPFLFFILERSTGLMMFMGRVVKV
jgi:serine protease inhibitor